MKSSVIVLVIVALFVLGAIAWMANRNQPLVTNIFNPAPTITSFPTTTPTPNPSQSITTTPPGVTISTSLVTVQNNSAKGQYLSDPGGKALYIYDNDTSGVSYCTGDCAATWPPYLQSGTTNSGNLPQNITTFSRSDGSLQYTYKNKPLYFYSIDKNSGEVYGDGVGQVWHLAKP